MVDKVFYLVMVPMVYMAFAACIVGVLMKFTELLKAPKHPHTLQIFPQRKAGGLFAAVEVFTLPTVRQTKPVLWVFLMLFHLGVVGLILSHLDLLPLINFMSADSPHMIGNGFVGVTVTISLLYFLMRRFSSPVREISVPADYLLLLLLFMIFITGDTISWSNSWNGDGFVLNKQDFGAYLDGMVRFTFENPADNLDSSHYVVLVVHVFLANLFLIVLPFSKIMHAFFAVALNRLRRVS
jgi:nitrate reductase gamma subunit